ncbi:MAG: hypothetical protein V3V33_16870 [Candidatus Lokiarchaeia archaeon]
MSSGRLDKFHYENLYEEQSDENFNISEIVIPFSRLFKRFESSDIYSGVERIPFKERDSEYKMILRQEFSNYIKD